MRGIGMLFWVEFKLYLRNPWAAFFVLAYPLMLVLFFGSLYGNRPDPRTGLGVLDLAIPGYLVLIAATVGMISLPIHLAVYRERRILRRLAVTPVAPLALLLAEGLALFALTASGTVLMVLAASHLYGLHLRGSPLAVALAFALVALALFAFGFLLAGLSTSARMAQGVSFLLFFPTLFLSGAGFPQELLTESLRRLAAPLPTTQAVTLLRGLWRGEALTGHLKEVLVLLAVFALSALLSGPLFRREG
ncbi:ABC transporter permease [Thermus islandicus]|uniref:ABC transporter permease n=1 Tax=Thermus islandicus TaxID=540988 RepID=UPI00041D47C8|nr:ABC transporter permease [Thermus islandicus]